MSEDDAFDNIYNIKGQRKKGAKMLELYKNIRQKRLELNMSQEELAKRVGYTSRSTIARIEKGEIDISRDKIFAFAKALKTAPSELMGLSGCEDALSDIANELSADSELLVIVEKATSDRSFRDRLLGIVKLMENEK